MSNLNTHLKQMGEDCRDELTEAIAEFLRNQYPSAAIRVGENTSNTPTIHFDHGGPRKVNITITRARS